MTARGRRPGMRDVAAVAGVSHQTVSRVLNDHPNVRPQTRQRVLDAIAELGYRPNYSARALVTSRTGILGVITDGSGLFGPTSTMIAVEEAARQASYFVSVATVGEWAYAAIGRSLEHFMSQRVEGIVVLAAQDEAADAVRSFDSPIPIVMIGPPEPSVGMVGTVGVDQHMGARLATRHLLDLGHRQVVHLAGPGDWFDARARVEGWRDELASEGIEAGEPMRGDWSAERGYQVGLELVAGDLPTAVFAANDQLSLGLLRAFAESGVRVPDDISVVGFDDVPGASHFYPPLTTVCQEFHLLGRSALKLLLDLIDGEGSEVEAIRPRLVVRASSGPPRARPRPDERADHPRRWHPSGDDHHHHGRDLAPVRVVAAHGEGATRMNQPRPRFVVGVDFGTLSGRAIVVRVDDGAEMGSAVHDYPHGVMDERLATTGEELPPDWALQVPEDYREVLRRAVPAAVADAGVAPADVIGIATDFTASTPLPVLDDGTPLCELDGFRDRPHAYVKLWKHHAAQPQADRINQVAEERNEPWLARYGGLISSEWEYAKALQLLEEDPETYHRMDRWVEAADWIVWQLSGEYVRNSCTAGYKGIYQDGGYPSPEFEAALNAGFEGFAADKLEHTIGRLGTRAGGLTPEAAAWTGLPEGIAVAVGNVDAHVTAPAACAIEPGQMVAIMGTSTCHVMNGESLHHVPGMCGVVEDGIVSGLWGYEAGQSGVGDIFGWFVDSQVPARYEREAEQRGIGVHEYLTELASQQPVGAHGLVALDWLSGNRSVLVDHELSGLIVGLTLATRPEDIYRALLEATAFGTRTIIEGFNDAGVPVTGLTVAGGLLKNAFLMQIYADVTRLTLDTIASEQGPGLGAAIHAAVAAGAYPDVRAASAAMGKVNRAVYQPIEDNSAVYDDLYREYTLLHDHFGRGANDVMHRLKAIQRRARGFGAKVENVVS